MAGTIIGVIVAVVVTLLIAVPVTCKVAVDKKVRKDAEIIGTAEDKARNILDEALKAAETKKRETLLEVKEESLRTKMNWKGKPRNGETSCRDTRSEFCQKRNLLTKKPMQWRSVSWNVQRNLTSYKKKKNE